MDRAEKEALKDSDDESDSDDEQEEEECSNVSLSVLELL